MQIERLIQENRRIFDAYWLETEELFYRGLLSGSDLSYEVWTRSLMACGYDDRALINVAFESFSRHVEGSYRLFDDAHDILEKLHARYPLVLVTNGPPDTQRPKIEAAQIGDRFEHIIISGELGTPKPNKAIFQVALDAVGAHPEQALHIGDSLSADVAGALNVGLTAVWINRRRRTRASGDPKPHHEIISLAELPGLLDD